MDSQITDKWSLGKIAYEAYSENRNWKTYDDKPMPKWDELRPEIQAAWEAAADKVAELVMSCS